MPLSKGVRLGPYEIVAPIGAGGMGEVYRATDTRLGRPVAIKIIAMQAAADPKRRLRFEREAKAISSLNHPNICALYDVGEMSLDPERENLQYIVMEYLEGETLELRLSRGPLPVDQAVMYGIQIADALDKAHRKQILHRDMKPANIMLTRSGARLFDFGLAKFYTDAAENKRDEKDVATSTEERPITADGAVVGTPQYVSPEQLRGLEPDARSDIFSLGVCLYEMISGKRPFAADSRAGLIAAVLERDPPPLSQERIAVPPALSSIVKHCLAKDPDERIQTAHDVKLALERIADDFRASGETAPAPVKPIRRTFAIGAGGVLVALAAGIAIVWSGRQRPAAAESTRRFSITLPASAPLASGSFEKLAVSPDGTRLVYVGGSAPTRLYTYSLQTEETKPLPGTEGGRGPFFSPDGAWVGFYTTDGDLKKTSLAGGSTITLTKAGDLRGACWGSDDKIIFATLAFPLRRIAASGGAADTVTLKGAAPNIRWPACLPESESLLVTLNDFSGDYANAKVAAASLKSGEITPVVAGGTSGRYAAGNLLYWHSDSLLAQAFDPHRMTPTGAPRPVAADVDSYFSSGMVHFAVANDGSLFYLPRSTIESQRELQWVTRSGQSQPVTNARNSYADPRLSPDGTRLLVAIGGEAHSDLWMFDLAHGAWTRLTAQGRNLGGIWSPGGDRIAFASTRSGGFGLFVMSADATDLVQIAARRSWDFPSSWSSDGKVIAVVEQYRTTFNDISTVAAQKGAAPQPLIATTFDERDPAFSPDGRWIAYRSNETGRDEIYVQDYPPRGRRWVVSTNGGSTPVWRRDGGELFYREGAAVMSVITRLSRDFSASKPQVLFRGEFEEEFDVSADGSRFIMVRRPTPPPATQINVILGLLGREGR